MAAQRVFRVPELLEMILLELSYDASKTQRAAASMRDWDYDSPRKFKAVWLEPLTSLAPLRRVSRDFNDALTKSSPLHREMFHSGPTSELLSDSRIRWRILAPIRRILSLIRTYVGQNDTTLSNDVKFYDDGVSLTLDVLRMSATHRFREKQHEHDLRTGSLYQALMCFLADHKRSDPAASWRQVRTFVPQQERECRKLSLEVTFEHDMPGSIKWNGESWIYQRRLGFKLRRSKKYTETFSFSDRSTLGDVFQWWVDVMEGFASHERAAFAEDE